VTARAVRAERDRLKQGSVALSRLSKKELVNLAVDEAGYRREAAQQETAGQLRLIVKEVRQQILKTEWELPSRLTKMSKSELQEATSSRRLPATGGREEMIRLLRQWKETSEELGEVAEYAQVQAYVEGEKYQSEKFTQRPAVNLETGSRWMMVDEQIPETEAGPPKNSAAGARGSMTPGSGWDVTGASTGVDRSILSQQVIGAAKDAIKQGMTAENVCKKLMDTPQVGPVLGLKMVMGLVETSVQIVEAEAFD